MIRFTLSLAALTVLLNSAPVEFNRDVRPILSDNCFGCHGPDAKTKNIPFRLDIEEQAKSDLGGGRHGIVPGSPENSELIKRITTDVKFKKMPPLATGHALTPAEREILTRWIAEGAKWQKHWSFIPPVKLALPAGANPIDYFIRARLDKDGLKPNPEAPKEKLIRRATLDLTGIPPTPAEVDAFLADSSPTAYERLVDRLLARAQFGERMAMRWLDNARYADSNGYQFDGERQMWRWRDYVIDSFNHNKPFNQFVVEQIAGDLIPNATLEQKMGTGFNRNHRANTEFGIIAEEYSVEYVIDRVETNSAVFLGLTFGCARCHNHKYDPLTQKEMYQFYAYFNNVPELGRAMKYGNSPPLIPAPTTQQQAELTRLVHQIGEARAAIHISPAQQSAWERSLDEKAYWRPSADLKTRLGMENPDETRANGGQVSFVPGKVGKAVQLEGGKYLDAGFNSAPFDMEDRFTIAAWIYADTAPNGTLFSVMNDKPKGRGFGLEARNGAIHVHFTSDYNDDAIRVDSQPVLKPKTWHHVALVYNGSRMANGVKVLIDSKAIALKTSEDSLYRPLANAGKTFGEPFRIGAGGGPEKRFTGLIDELNIWARALDETDIANLSTGQTLRQLAALPIKDRNAQAQRQLREAYLESAAPPAERQAWQKLIQLEQQRESFERSLPTVMVMAEMPERRPTFILQRGEYNKPGEKVEPGLPAFLPPLPPGAPNNRLGLAQWMVSRDNPLTARVNVNRFWQMIFGTGLVKTTEDFGSQGEWPSHPELLDWLAVEFQDSGWDTKQLIRRMVTSAAYRQDSSATAEMYQRDPENRLLARGPRLRLPAEAVRDQALAAAGLLNPTLNGPSVKPYQPAGLWEEQSMQNMDYVQSHGADLYRRSLYMYWKRTIAPPMMVNFDASTRESCVVRESRTNTPLQALNLMNDVTFLEAGRQIGRRMLEEGGQTDESRIAYGFKLLLSRAPAPKEAAILKANLNYNRDYFASNPGRVDTYLHKGESKIPSTLDAREQAAYMALGSLLLNLDEAVTKE